MKKKIVLLAMFLCMATVYPYSGSTSIHSTTDKEKKISKYPKLSKKNNCFKLCNPYKINTFCRLIQVGNYKAVKSLIEKGTEVNNISIKLTPLMYAARHNRADIVKLLIDNGADLHVKSSRKGFTALKWAKIANATEAYDVIYKALKKITY